MTADDDPILPPPLRRNESAAEFQARDAYLAAMTAPRAAWPERWAADIAYVVEALGLTPDTFEAVLGLAHAVTANYVPAGIQAGGYRFSVCRPNQVYGEPLGVYLGVVVVARAAAPP